jgi:Protein of unknown function (DUF3429)
MTAPTPTHNSIQRLAWVLSALGLLPFLWPACGAALNTPMFGFSPTHAMLAYGSIILSFLGGTVWMSALHLSGNRNLSQWGLWLSIMPALTAWVALLIGGSSSLLVLVAGFAGVLSIESAMYRMAIIPAWFWRLRWKISSIVMVLLLITWWHALAHLPAPPSL